MHPSHSAFTQKVTISRAILIAPVTFTWIPGWRISFYVVGIIILAVGILIRIYAKAYPHFCRKREDSYQISCNSFQTEIKEMGREAMTFMKIPSFQIIVGQGIIGYFRVYITLKIEIKTEM